MKFKFTIGRKIGTGFGILLFLTLIVFILTKRTIDSSREINYNIIKVHSPSVDALQELKIHIEKSKRLINNWVNIQSGPDAIDKQKLNHLTDVDLPYSLKEIDRLSVNWAEEEKEIKEKLFKSIDTLFELHAQVKELLSTWESYEDPMVQFSANDLIDPNSGQINTYTDKVIWLLDELILRQRNHTKDSSDKMILSFKQLEFVVIYLGIALGIGGILIAFFTVRSIVKPVQQLRKLLLLLGKGIIPKQRMNRRTDEIGDMSEALNDLVDGFERTTEFARAVGAGNFESEYQPLSENDTLGYALLKMREDLHITEQMLQEKVRKRTEEIEKQKKEIEMLYTHVTDSIKYAKRIQQAILPSDEMVQQMLPNSFVLFKPKDIVSGDFYWVEQKEGKSLFAALDCTGHGVPGAFMTIVGYNTLNQIMTETDETQPANILNMLNEGITKTLHQGSTDVKDGMDAAMCAIDFEKNEVEFAGAYNPLYLIRNGNLQQIKGDKFPIGAFIDNKQHLFTNHTIKLEKGDTLYIFSDGYADQFGGSRGKKFMYRNFRELLLKIQDKDMQEQKSILNETVEEWKGDLEQVDDILIIGLRISRPSL